VFEKGSKNKIFEYLLRFKGTVGNDPQILSEVVTGDETWWYGFDPKENKHRANEKP